MNAAELKSNLSKTKKAIDLSCKLVEKDLSTIRLIGVTKTQSADTVRQAYNAGITDIGENYVQEALTKMDRLPVSHSCKDQAQQISIFAITSAEKLLILKRKRQLLPV